MQRNTLKNKRQLDTKIRLAAASRATVEMMEQRVMMTASPFTPGNIAVVQVATAGSTNTTGTILELQPTGANQSSPVQSIPVTSEYLSDSGTSSFLSDTYPQDKLAIPGYTTNTVTVSPTAAAWAGNTVTITVANSFVAGNSVTVSGIAPSAYDGTFTIASASGSKFTYALGSNPGTATVTGATAVSMPADLATITASGARDIQTLSASGTFSGGTTYTESASGNQTRSAASLDDTNWFIADKGGLFTNGASANSLSPSVNIEDVRSFGGTVYVASTKTPAPVSTLSADNATAVTSLPGLGTADTSIQDFYLIQSGQHGAAFDILYTLDQGSGTTSTINKFSLVGGSWTSNGSYTVQNPSGTGINSTGMIAENNGNSGATLFVTTTNQAAANSLMQVTDTAGYNQTIAVTSGNNVNLYTAAAGTSLKGLDFAPVLTGTTATSVTNVTPSGGASGTTPVTLTATVTGSSAAPADGMVQFYDGATLLATATYAGGHSSGNTTTFSITTTAISSGIYNNITAVYIAPGTGYSSSVSSAYGGTLTIGGPPVFTGGTSTSILGGLGSYANYTGVSATGSPAPTFSLSGNPSWVSINSTTGALSFSGVTDPATTTANTFTIIASNGTGSAPTESFTVNVEPTATLGTGGAKGSTVTQNFSTMSLASNPVTPSTNSGVLDLSQPYPNGFGTVGNSLGGWYAVNLGGGTDNMTEGEPITTTGSLYDFNNGTNASLGTISTGTDSRFGEILVNNTTSTLTQFSLSYVGEEWWQNSGLGDTLNFSYQLGATSLPTGSTGTTVSSLGYSVPAFTGTAGALDGSQTANQTAINGLVSGISWAPGTTLAIYWDKGASAISKSPGLGIANVSVNASAGPGINNAVTTANVTDGGSSNTTLQVTTFNSTATSFSSTYTGTGSAPSWISFNTTTGLFTATPQTSGTVDAPTSYTYSVTASDGTNTGLAQTFTITELPASPTITSGNSATVQAGVTGTFNVTTTNSPSSYVLSGSAPSWVTIASSGTDSATLTFTNPASVTKTTVYTFTITASNAAGGSTPQTFTLTELPTVAYGTAGAFANQTFSLLPTDNTDPTATTPASAGPFDLTGSFPSGFGSGDGLGGWYAVNIDPSAATEKMGEGEPDTTTGALYDFNNGTSGSQSLGTISTSTYSTRFGEILVNNTGTTLTKFSLAYTGEEWWANNGGANTLSFGYEVGATTLPTGTTGFTAVSALNYTGPGSGSGSSVDGSQIANQTAISGSVNTGFSWAPGQTLAIFWDKGVNPSGGSPGLGIANVQFSAANGPAITSAAATTVIAGATSTFQLTTDTTASSYAISGQPSWVALNTSTGLLTFTPTAGVTSPISASFTITATGSSGVGTPQTFTVTEIPSGPSINSASNVNAYDGVTSTFALASTGTSTTTYSITSTGTPGWINLNSTTGVLTFTPTAGTVTTGTQYTLTIEANDPNAGGAGAVSILTVTEMPTIAYSAAGSTAGSQNFSGLSAATGNVAPIADTSSAAPYDLSGVFPGGLSNISANDDGLNGWFAENVATGAATMNIAQGEPTTSTGALYDFNDGTNVGLGTVSTTHNEQSFGEILVNTSGSTLQSFTLSYTGEEWWQQSNVAQPLNFYYAVNSTSLQPSAGTNVPTLGFTTPVPGAGGDVDGGTSTYQTAVSSTVGNLNWLPGQSLIVYWDKPAASTGDGLGIANVNFTASTANPSIAISFGSNFNTGGAIPTIAYSGSPVSVDAADISATYTPGGVNVPAADLSFAGINGNSYGGIGGTNTAPTAAGDYSVTATFDGVSSTAADFTITAVTPTVTINNFGPVTFGTSYTPTATVTSGDTGAISYSYTGTGITGSTSVAPTNVGSYQVTASVAASGNYGVGTSAAFSFSITAVTPTITVNSFGPVKFGTSYTPTATVTAGDTGAISYSYTGTGITGSTSIAPTNVGSYQVTASVAAAGNYGVGTSTPFSFSITAVTPTVTINNFGPVTFGTSYTPTATVTSGDTGAISYSYTGTGITGSTSVAPTNVGSYQVTASVAAAGNYGVGTSTPFSYSITAATPTVTVTAPTVSPYNATATITGVGGVTLTGYIPTFVYTNTSTLATSTTAPTAAGTYNVVASIPASGNYAAASSTNSATFTIAPVSTPPTIANSAFTINSSALANAVIGNVGASGSSGANFAYSLSAVTGTNIAAFQINSAGVLTLAVPADLSSTTNATTAKVNVIVTDSISGLSSTTLVTITRVATGARGSAMSPIYSVSSLNLFHLPALQPTGTATTTVGTVAASITYTGQIIKYSIVSTGSTPAGMFSIGATGIITTKLALTLGNSYTFNVIATDGTSTATSTVAVTLSVTKATIVNTTPTYAILDTVATTSSKPLSGVTVAGTAAGDSVSATVTINPAYGLLADPTTLNAVPHFTQTTSSSGIYTVTGTPAQVTTAIEDLMYAPAQNHIAAGYSYTVPIKVAVTDSGSTATDTVATTVTVTEANTLPKLTNITAAQTVFSDASPIHPFSASSVVDPDTSSVFFSSAVAGQPAFVGQQETVIVTQTGTALGVVSGGVGGFAEIGMTNQYIFTGTAAQATKALEALTFTPTKNVIASGSSKTAIFTVKVTDAAGGASIATGDVTTVTIKPTGRLTGLAATATTPTVTTTKLTTGATYVVAKGTQLLTLTPTDSDPSDVLTYAFSTTTADGPDTDNAKFAIVAGKLSVNSTTALTAGTTYHVLIKVTNLSGDSITDALAITIGSGTTGTAAVSVISTSTVVRGTL